MAEHHSLSSSESSSSEEDEIANTEVKGDLSDLDFMKLEQQLKDNPRDYSKHLEKITELRKRGEFEELDAALEALNAIFPLTEQLWLQWIQDTERCSGDDVERIVSLFERSVAEYRSISVWQAYLRFVMDVFSSNPKRIVTVCDAALDSVGCHIAQGSSIWRMCLNYAQARAEGLSGAEQTEALERVYALNRRVSNVVLRDMDKLREEREQWLTRFNPDFVASLQRGYKAARNELENRLKFEKSIISTVPRNLRSWRKYLDFEQSKGNTARIISLYERAVIPYWWEQDIWSRYCNYVDMKRSDDAEFIRSVYVRATRNVAGCGLLWAMRARARERLADSSEDIISMLREAVYTGMASLQDLLQVLHAGFDVYARALASSKDKNVESLQAWFSFCSSILSHDAHGVPGKSAAAQMTCVFARVLTREDLLEDAARILQSAVNTFAKYEQVWLALAEWERYHGSKDKARSTFKRAIHACGSLAIAHAWIEFERVYGTVEQVQLAVSRCSSILRVAAAAEAAAAADAAAAAAGAGAGAVEQQGSAAKRARDEEQQGSATTKRPRADSSAKIEVDAQQLSSKSKSKGAQSTMRLANVEAAATEEDIRLLVEPFGAVSAIRFVRREGMQLCLAFVGFRDENAAALATTELDGTAFKGQKLSARVDQIRGVDQRSNESAQHNDVDMQSAEEAKEDRDESAVVFVSNLKPDCTDAELLELFSTAGKVKEVRRRTGKMFGYVEFERAEDVQGALELANTMLNGRPIRVARSNPPKKAKVKAKPPQPRAAGTLLPRAMKKKAATTRDTKPKDNSEFRKLLGL